MRVRTSLDTSTTRASDRFLLSELELTYYLSRSLTTSYYTYRDSANIDTPQTSRWALRYRYEY
jgi:hypothetical protein